MKLYQATVLNEILIYIPCGWVTLMKTPDKNILWHSKVMFLKTDAAKTSFASARAVMGQTGLNTKMTNVLSLFDRTVYFGIRLRLVALNWN